MIDVRSEIGRFPPEADQPQAETAFATEGLLLAAAGTAESRFNVLGLYWLRNSLGPSFPVNGV
jgi:hypothetical protein